MGKKLSWFSVLLHLFVMNAREIKEREGWGYHKRKRLNINYGRAALHGITHAERADPFMVSLTQGGGTGTKIKIHHSQSSAPEGERQEQPGLCLSVCLSAPLCPDLGLCLSPFPSSIETLNRKHISLSVVFPPETSDCRAKVRTPSN